MNREQQSFFVFDEILRAKYDEFQLKHLEEVEFNGTHPLTFCTSVIQRKRPIVDFDFIKNYYEIVFVSKDIKYFTGLLYFLRPYINNFLQENRNYNQNIFDRRYLSYVSVAHQCVYNFWDRIGDLLYSFFETGLSEDRVYFGRVINNISPEYRRSENFVRLEEIYNTNIQPLIRERNVIVHYYQLESRTFLDSFRESHDINRLREQQHRKERFPEFFREHMELTFVGFELALNLINELPDRQ